MKTIYEISKESDSGFKHVTYVSTKQVAIAIIEVFSPKHPRWIMNELTVVDTIADYEFTKREALKKSALSKLTYDERLALGV
jgi:ribosomal protein L31